MKQEVKKRSTKKKDRAAINYFGELLDFDEEKEEENKEMPANIIIPQTNTGKHIVNAVNFKGEQDKTEDNEMVKNTIITIIPFLKPILWGDIESDDEY